MRFIVRYLSGVNDGLTLCQTVTPAKPRSKSRLKLVHADNLLMTPPERNKADTIISRLQNDHRKSQSEKLAMAQKKASQSKATKLITKGTGATKKRSQAIRSELSTARTVIERIDAATLDDANGEEQDYYFSDPEE